MEQSDVRTTQKVLRCTSPQSQSQFIKDLFFYREIFQGPESKAGIIYIKADQGDDAGDSWKLNAAADGVLTIGSDINVKNTSVAHLTITPNAVVANSTTAVAGNLTVGGNLTLSDNTNGRILVADGNNFNSVAVSGDISITNAGVVTIANDSVTLAKLAHFSRGRLIYGAGTEGVPSQLTPGSNGTVLTSDGTDISWEDASVSSTASNTFENSNDPSKSTCFSR